MLNKKKRGKMTLIDSRVKLKKKTNIWLKQIKTNAQNKK
jgi:hypothetical protein